MVRRRRSVRRFEPGASRELDATFTLVATDQPFRVFKTEHFVPSDQKMVVTAADPARSRKS